MASSAGAAEIELELARDLAVAGPSAQVTAIVSAARNDDRVTARRLHARGLDVVRFEHLPLLAVRGTAAELRAAAGVRGVRRLSANSAIRPALAQSRDFVRASTVHRDLGVTGKGVGVAVIDSGLDEQHPDLAPGVKENVYVLRESDMWALVADRPDEIPDAGTIVLPSDRDVTSGHGTHVAGIVGGRGVASDGRNRGIAPESDLIGIGMGKSRAVISVIAGMDYALEHRKRLNIQVVNNSWEKPHQEPLFTYDPENPVNVASKALHAAGIAVVYAVGNSGPAPDVLNTYAVWPWVLGVANGCVPGKDAQYSGCGLHDSSSRGRSGDPLVHPDVTAPGVGIVSTRSSLPDAYGSAPEQELQGLCGQADPMADFRWYTCRGGSSMAAPHVSGTMALLEQAAGCDLLPDQLYALVTGTATPMPAYAEWEAGSGFLDARAAVDRVRAERDELCSARKAEKPKPPKAKTPRAAGTALRLKPRPVVRRRSIRVGLRPTAPVWSVRIVARRGGRVVASKRLARLSEDATVVLRGRRPLGRGKYRVLVEARDAVGRSVRATARAKAR